MTVLNFHPDELLDREHKGTLSTSDRARLDEHLAQCAACRFERKLRADLAAEAKIAEDAVNLQAFVSGALLAAGQSAPMPAVAPASRGTPTRHRRWGMLVAASLLLATGIAAAQTGVVDDVLRFAREKTGLALGAKQTHAPQPHKRAEPPKQAAKTLVEPAPVEVSAPVVSGPSAEVAPSVAQKSADVSPTMLDSRVHRREHRHAPSTSTNRTTARNMPAPAAQAAASVQEPASVANHEHAPQTLTPQVTTHAVSPTAAALFARANGLRRRGEAREAAELYRQLGAEFAGSPEARLALVLLARLELDQGDMVQGLRGFDSYLATGDQALREQALAGRALALDRLGQHKSACAAFASLLKAYPESAYAPLAQRRCSEAE